MHEERKLRVAIGIFDRVAALSQASGELAVVFPPASVVRILARRDVLEDARRAIGVQKGNAHDSPQLAFVDFMERDPDRTSQSKQVVEDQITSFECWMESGLAKALAKQLEGGACAMFIPVSTIRDEQAAYRVLIDRSSGNVQLHDLPVAGR